MRVRLYLTAFVGGLVSLALELAASRLLAPAFGTSELVWVAIIGMILLYLSVGYVLGGRWADRSPYPATLFTLLVAAGLAIAAVPFIAKPVLGVAVQGMLEWNVALVAGPLLAVLVLFVIPVTLLACISPFVIRLAMTDVSVSGVTSGKVYAISTLGSFLGTFLPNLVLIPWVGTRDAFLLLAALTTATGLWGLWPAARRRFWALCWTLPLILALMAVDSGLIKPQTGLIYEEESTYNYIQVLESERGRRFLLLNEGQGVHSVYAPSQVLTGGTWDYFLAAPLFNPTPFEPSDVDRALIVGLAAGTISKQLTQVYGPIAIDGVEIDPAIVEVGRTYFDMTEENLNVIIGDGRTFLQTTDRYYDLVAVDAYRLPYIPWHLTTVEFFQEIRARLTDSGVVAINAGHTPDDWRVVEALTATLRHVYPSVHVIEVPQTFNAIIVATVLETSPENLRTNLALVENASLKRVGERALENLTSVTPGALVFTDDHAPVELLTDALVLHYVLGGQ
ncbi:MAG: fused MFS/spermidine synthase [Anaerolineae bacterium]|nr:fused MFS/spermidine synthase [Anaerolineae bacterium]